MDVVYGYGDRDVSYTVLGSTFEVPVKLIP